MFIVIGLKFNACEAFVMITSFFCMIHGLFYSTAAIVEQVEVALPTAPTWTANQLQPPKAIYPQIALLADKLHYPSTPKPTTSRVVFDSDSD